jgi:hypothetical protein
MCICVLYSIVEPTVCAESTCGVCKIRIMHNHICLGVVYLHCLPCTTLITCKLLLLDLS